MCTSRFHSGFHSYIFVNDLFLFMKKLVNFADSNTLNDENSLTKVVEIAEIFQNECKNAISTIFQYVC